MNIADSIKIVNSQILFKEPIPILPLDRIYNGEYVGDGKLTFGQDKLFYIKNSLISININFSVEPVIKYSGIYMTDIDPATGRIIGPERLLRGIQQRTERYYYSMPKGTYYSYSDFEVSPNDSVLYYIEKQYNLDSINNRRIVSSIYRVFSWRFRDGGVFNPIPIYILDQDKNPEEAITSIAINPFGKLNIIIKNLEFGKKDIILLNLNETNNPKGLSSSFSKIILAGNNNATPIKPQLYLYDFIRLGSKIDYSCEAVVSFQNQSDLSGGMRYFTWYFTKESGKIDTITGFEPKVIYKKSGNYPFKVHGYSPRGAGYGEWYIDTLHIRIPEKPVASFKAVDTVICRYLPLQFKNFSHNKETNPTSSSKYVWTYGDGNTSNLFDPTHTYTQPGYYTVSLFYSNGYCDSTLTKNQYIHVVDAPKAGFTLANKQGCSPFTAQFTDTVSLNVTKKEYFFSDSVIWKPISKPKFSYTFTKPGHYWAVQKLYGHTGCVIRTDSVQVFVSKGLLLSDSIRIVSASYDLDNVLHLDWLPHPAAINYQTFKSLNGVSFSPLGQTKDTFITDKAVPVGKVFYQVKGVDSCGSFSSSQNIAAPAFISGHTVNGNEAALINQNLQEGFGTPFKTQLYGSFDTKFQFIALKTNPANPFTDPDFAEQDALRKCYRLVSNFTNQVMFSNNFCLDYVPVVYMPNIFSPDGNGLNDKFGPITYGVESYIMSIYNRWGEIIYAGSEAWNGNYKGQVVMDGIYFYQVFLIENNKKVVNKSGTVQVVR